MRGKRNNKRNREKKNNNGRSLSYPRFYGTDHPITCYEYKSFSEEILMQLRKPMPLACHQVTSSCNSYNNNITDCQWIRLMSFKLTVNVFTLSPPPNPSPKNKNKNKTHSFQDHMTAYTIKLLNIKE